MLEIYSCARLSAWISERTCSTLRARAALADTEAADRRRRALPPNAISGQLPCAGCPGVLELAKLRGTPRPRRLAQDRPLPPRRSFARIHSSRGA